MAALLAAYGVILACLPLPAPARAEAGPRVGPGLRTIARDGRVWYFGVIALLMGMLQQPFVAFVVAYAHQTLGTSPTVTTVLAATWIVGVVAATTRASRSRNDARTFRLRTSAAIVGAGVLAATVVPSAAAIAVAIVACAFGISTLTLTVKAASWSCIPAWWEAPSRSCRPSSSRASSSPIGFGRVADPYGVHAGLACFGAVAFVLLLAAAAGDWAIARGEPRRRSGGPDGCATPHGFGGPEFGAA